MTPLKPAAVRIGRNESGNRTGLFVESVSPVTETVYWWALEHCPLSPSGYVYVDLHSQEEVNKALKKNKDYIGKKHKNPDMLKPVLIWKTRAAKQYVLLCC